MNKIQEKKLIAEIDARAEEAIKKLQNKNLISMPGDRDRGFFEGIQHAISCICQMQENYHEKMSLDSAVTRLEAELDVIAQRKK